MTARLRISAPINKGATRHTARPHGSKLLDLGLALRLRWCSLGRQGANDIGNIAEAFDFYVSLGASVVSWLAVMQL